MSTTITVKQNQSMMDVIIQGTGSMEAGMQFCEDNGVAISDVPAVNTVYVVSDAGIALGDAGTLQYLQQNGIVIGTLNEGTPPLGFEVVLYPLQVALPDPLITTPPASYGVWVFSVEAAPGFIATHGIPHVLGPSVPNPVDYERVNNIVSGGPYGTVNENAFAEMDYERLFYTIPWSHIPTNMLVWSDYFGSGAYETIQYVDNSGNAAMGFPVVVLTEAQTPVACWMPEILVELVTADESNVTLRLTMTHVDVTPDSVNLFFIDEATGGIPDPDDPLNPNKCIVTATAGVHTFGAIGQYIHTDGFTRLAYSIIETVVEVAPGP